MKTLEIDISSQQELAKAARQLLSFAGEIKVFVFEAEMGAGKTTFIKELCRVLGSSDNFSSPTYSIVNEYSNNSGKIYHFDLYRLKSTDELLDIGFEEYVEGKQYCFIEWPAISLQLLPKPYLSIVINVKENNRYLSAQIIE